MDTVRQKETGKTQNNMEKDCGKGKRRGGVEELGCSGQGKVEMHCEGPMCHTARGGQITDLGVGGSA